MSQLILETVSDIDFDECRNLINKGVALGMLQRMHRHIIVKKDVSETLSKILQSGETRCDELCLLFNCSETDLLKMLSTESEDSFLNIMF